jgi:hypothetical protein
MSMPLGCLRTKLDPDEITDKIFDHYSAEVANTEHNHILVRKTALGKLSKVPVVTAQQAISPTPPHHLTKEKEAQLENDHDQWHEGQQLFVEQCPLCILQREIDAVSTRCKKVKQTPNPEPVIIGTWVRFRSVHAGNLVFNEKSKRWEAFKVKAGERILLGGAETKEGAIRIYHADVRASQENTLYKQHHLHRTYFSGCMYCMFPGREEYERKLLHP